MRSKIKLKIILYLTGVLFAAVFLFCSAYIFITISSLNKTLITSTSNLDNQNKKSLTLEEGSITNKKMFQTYLSFTSLTESSNLIVENFKGQNFLRSYKDSYEVLKDFKISNLLSNKCSELNCYQIYIPFEYISTSLWKSLIGVEDNRFLGHDGVDFKAIVRAIIVDIKKMKFVQGGSTITQQLAKNLFFSSEKTLSRKIKELIVSIYLESKFSKSEILELYLNNVYWGSVGGLKSKGIFVASYTYFDKHPIELNYYESAILISLLKGPGFYNPIRNLERLKKRVLLVVSKLLKRGLFTSGVDIEWSDNEWKSWREQLISKTQNKKYKNLWITKKNKSNGLDDFRKYILI